MGDDEGLEGFDGTCRLFPLPEVVLFPHAVLPLHIFEPRYRQMTEDALGAGDKLITMVRLRPPDVSSEPGRPQPAIEEVAGLGRILRHERLPDGRFHLLLQGLKRVRLIREVPSDRLYRVAEAEILQDEDTGVLDDPRRDDLIALFRRARPHDQGFDPDLEALLDSVLPLGALTDFIGHALGVPAAIKQELLTETRVDRRADRLRVILGGLLAHVGEQAIRSRPYPPPFSAN